MRRLYREEGLKVRCRGARNRWELRAHVVDDSIYPRYIMVMYKYRKVQEKLKVSSESEFGFVMAGACAVFGGVVMWENPNGLLGFWLIGLCSLFLFLALFFNAPLKPLSAAWLKLGEEIHKIVSPLVMGVMYFFVVSPIALILRFSGKELLSLRKKPEAESYWVECSEDSLLSNMEQQF